MVMMLQTSCRVTAAQMHFAGWSQPSENYMATLEGAGFAISALQEPIPAVTAAFTHGEQWTRIPPIPLAKGSSAAALIERF